ncbi:MAG: UMP kinase, partial [Acidimicrobiia bacterium]|nr:UMP kinase [Acidimicrobiia bacterium]
MTGSPRRVLLKLSGEAFADPEIGYGISSETVRVVAGEIAASQQAGHQVGIVV